MMMTFVGLRGWVNFYIYACSKEEWKQSVTPAMQFYASQKDGASRALRAASEIKAQPLLFQ